MSLVKKLEHLLNIPIVRDLYFGLLKGKNKHNFKPTGELGISQAQFKHYTWERYKCTNCDKLVDAYNGKITIIDRYTYSPCEQVHESPNSFAKVDEFFKKLF